MLCARVGTAQHTNRMLLLRAASRDINTSPKELIVAVTSVALQPVIDILKSIDSRLEQAISQKQVFEPKKDHQIKS